MDIVTEVYWIESNQLNQNQIKLNWNMGINRIVLLFIEWEWIFKAAQGLSLISPFSL